MGTMSGQLAVIVSFLYGLPAAEKSWYDYLCGNHTRNLPLDQWNREFEAYIKEHLGDAIMEVQKEGGGRTRVEGSGILLLRAMCRLTHTGNGTFWCAVIGSL